jgi:hypothetical protein
MLILDFDGTVTDAEKEGAPFRDGYLEDIAILAGRPIEEVRQLAERFEAEVRADPDNHGWIYDGAIVAPATVDPYLRIMPVARRIFDEVGVFADDGDRSRLLDGILYKYNYQKTNVAFREGAFELLSTLVGTPSYVVTNSHTEPVRNKIRSLDRERGMLDWWVPRVRGRARKYVVEPSYSHVDERLDLPGLSRPVLLRRPHYCSVIEELLEEEGHHWSDLLVVGDIFELDLALPLAKGASVALMVNDFTPAYERDYVEGHPRGQLIASLSEIAALVGAE